VSYLAADPLQILNRTFGFVASEEALRVGARRLAAKLA
jgi:hypothetical protein